MRLSQLGGNRIGGLHNKRLLLSRFEVLIRSGRLAAPTQRDEYCRAAEPRSR